MRSSSIEDVFVARIASLRARVSASENISFLISRFSTTASMMTSARAMPRPCGSASRRATAEATATGSLRSFLEERLRA